MLQTSQVDTGRESAVPQPVEWLGDGVLRLVDQTLLPMRLEYVYCRSVGELAEAIRALRVRGAPAIGVAAAYGLCLAANSSTADDPRALLNELEAAARTLRETRPTAVNLPWALNEVLTAAKQSAQNAPSIKSAVNQMAQRIDS